MSKIADSEERQQFWTYIMRDENTQAQHRLKASELLGKVQGDFDSEYAIMPNSDDVAVLSDEDLLRILNREGGDH